MNQIVVKKDLAPEIISSLVVGGDLSGLTNEQRVSYYKYRCQQVGLDPSAKPFDLLKLNGKLILYANASCTQQLCQIHGLSPTITDRAVVNGIYCVTSRVTGEGRTTENLGAVPVENLKGDMLANAMMKAVTKAHRRTVLMHCGLGMLDETEVETIPNAQPQRGNPLKREAEHIIAEMESCGDKDQFDAYVAGAEVVDFLRRAHTEAEAKGGVNQADVVSQMMYQIREALPEKKINKRAFIKSTSDYGDSPVAEAPPASSPEAPVPTAGPTFSAIAEKCMEQFDIVDDADGFKRAQAFALEHQAELAADEKKALNELSRRVGARLREAA